MDKVHHSTDEAIDDIPDGSSIAISGFFTAATPVNLIRSLVRKGVKNLTIICQQMGPGNDCINDLIIAGQVEKAICNYPFYRSATRGADSVFEQAFRSGKIALEVYPMGTFVEKLRAAGAGIAAFYTPTGVGTVIERGKEKRNFNGRDYLLESAIKPDYAFVHAWKGDRVGNLLCHKTARNYNPEMAASARITIAEVEQLVKPGELEPDMVHVPGIYVNRIVKVDRQNYIPSID
jgi:3-oxoacid CoA-transferase A subunit